MSRHSLISGPQVLLTCLPVQPAVQQPSNEWWMSSTNQMQASRSSRFPRWTAHTYKKWFYSRHYPNTVSKSPSRRSILTVTAWETAGTRRDRAENWSPLFDPANHLLYQLNVRLPSPSIQNPQSHKPCKTTNKFANALIPRKSQLVNIKARHKSTASKRPPDDPLRNQNHTLIRPRISTMREASKGDGTGPIASRTHLDVAWAVRSYSGRGGQKSNPCEVPRLVEELDFGVGFTPLNPSPPFLTREETRESVCVKVALFGQLLSCYRYKQNPINDLIATDKNCTFLFLTIFIWANFEPQILSIFLNLTKLANLYIIR